jgi:hypothetical protein
MISPHRILDVEERPHLPLVGHAPHGHAGAAVLRCQRREQQQAPLSGESSTAPHHRTVSTTSRARRHPGQGKEHDLLAVLHLVVGRTPRRHRVAGLRSLRMLGQAALSGRSAEPMF